MKKEIKEDIDNMNYRSMLTLWRNARVGHSYFQGEVGDYFAKVMKEKRELISNEDHAQISKGVGW